MMEITYKAEQLNRKEILIQLKFKEGENESSESIIIPKQRLSILPVTIDMNLKNWFPSLGEFVLNHEDSNVQGV